MEHQRENSTQTTRAASLEVSLATGDPRATWRTDATRQRSKRTTDRRVDRGRERHHVLLGPLSQAIQALAAAVRPHEVWLFIDEWSALPWDLQPLLADLLRRTWFAVGGVVVKIGAVHGRSQFADLRTSGHPVGLELGADTAATLDLDDILLFDNGAAATLAFYSSLLHRHLQATTTRVDRVDGPLQHLMATLDTPSKLIRRLFATQGAFHNLVLGAEGVPRDALQIAGLAAGAAYDQPITVGHVAEATRAFFLRDKETRIPRPARPVFNHVIDQAARQKSRLIPLRREGESDDELIQRLYDARVIHRVRQGISLDPQRPGEVYIARHRAGRGRSAGGVRDRRRAPAT